jgi:Ca2+/Na+ antiporter
MSKPGRSRLNKILAFTAAVEACTGLVLVIDPAVVVSLLLGMDVPGVGAVLGRCFGIALIALGLACWPNHGTNLPASRAMLIYNALIALFLAYLGTVERLGGLLLWPGVALHAAVTVLLVWSWRYEQRTKAAA